MRCFRNIVKIYFYNINKYSFFALNHCCFFSTLFIINVLFSNHIIKLTEFIKLVQVNDQNLIFFFFNVCIVLIYCFQEDVSEYGNSCFSKCFSLRNTSK
jgi:hypothetical protein